MLLEPVEQVDALDGLAAYQGREERLDGLLFDEAEHFADPLGGKSAGIGGKELVEHRFGVAHPAGGQARDQVDRLGLGLTSVAGQDGA